MAYYEDHDKQYHAIGAIRNYMYNQVLNVSNKPYQDIYDETHAKIRIDITTDIARTLKTQVMREI